MFISDTDKRSCLKQALGTGAGASFAALFGGVYELYSHSVYSYYMIYAFAPLMVLSLVYVWWGGFSKRPPKRAARALYTASASTASVGMIATGVVTIYGSSNRLLLGYCILTGATLAAAVVCRLIEKPSPTPQTQQ
ncbi:hypothetical protein [Ruminococcus sp. NK3A76]|uniref:hypothetical protein n=1 Tax=Ruminococcus sp. NK3A76 TaxID=877411 RepID=UPI0004911C35|nr:hypothetical protein [Ruminococcus sp. NK3A76]